MRNPLEQRLYDEARKRVEKSLNGLYNALGPLNREELAAMMDGAQDGWQEWQTPEQRALEVKPVGHEVRVTRAVRRVRKANAPSDAELERML